MIKINFVNKNILIRQNVSRKTYNKSIEKSSEEIDDINELLSLFEFKESKLNECKFKFKYQNIDYKALTSKGYSNDIENKSLIENFSQSVLIRLESEFELKSGKKSYYTSFLKLSDTISEDFEFLKTYNLSDDSISKKTSFLSILILEKEIFDNIKIQSTDDIKEKFVSLLYNLYNKNYHKYVDAASNAFFENYENYFTNSDIGFIEYLFDLVGYSNIPHKEYSYRSIEENIVTEAISEEVNQVTSLARNKDYEKYRNSEKNKNFNLDILNFITTYSVVDNSNAYFNTELFIDTSKNSFDIQRKRKSVPYDLRFDYSSIGIDIDNFYYSCYYHLNFSFYEKYFKDNSNLIFYQNKFLLDPENMFYTNKLRVDTSKGFVDISRRKLPVKEFNKRFYDLSKSVWGVESKKSSDILESNKNFNLFLNSILERYVIVLTSKTNDLDKRVFCFNNNIPLNKITSYKILKNTSFETERKENLKINLINKDFNEPSIRII